MIDGDFMAEVKFKNKKVNIKKLEPFGFMKEDDGYIYHADLLCGQMKLTVTITDEKIYTSVIDTVTDDEYVLHLVAEATGSFVGKVREEYEGVLQSIDQNCFETDVFKSDCAKKLIEYVRNTYGDELEFLWQKFDDNAIWRRKDTAKWYAALLTVSKRKLSLDSDELIEIIDLRGTPEEIEALVDNKRYFPGYHMNKKHWYTMLLDGSVSFEEICKRIDESYKLARK